MHYFGNWDRKSKRDRALIIDMGTGSRLRHPAGPWLARAGGALVGVSVGQITSHPALCPSLIDHLPAITWRNGRIHAWHLEWDEFQRKRLARHWPDETTKNIQHNFELIHLMLEGQIIIEITFASNPNSQAYWIVKRSSRYFKLSRASEI